jgi:hypothetical protein
LDKDEEVLDIPNDNAPGMHGTQGQSGFYTGPTSAASHLITVSFHYHIGLDHSMNAIS